MALNVRVATDVALLGRLTRAEDSAYWITTTLLAFTLGSLIVRVLICRNGHAKLQVAADRAVG